jgi:hypothetical protein
MLDWRFLSAAVFVAAVVAVATIRLLAASDAPPAVAGAKQRLSAPIKPAPGAPPEWLQLGHADLPRGPLSRPDGGGAAAAPAARAAETEIASPALIEDLPVAPGDRAASESARTAAVAIPEKVRGNDSDVAMGLFLAPLPQPRPVVSLDASAPETTGSVARPRAARPVAEKGQPAAARARSPVAAQKKQDAPAFPFLLPFLQPGTN